MATDLLVVKSFYNRYVEQNIDKYTDNVLFVNIDYRNMNLLIERFCITNYLSFFEYLKNIDSYRIVNLYNDTCLTDKYIWLGNKSNKKIRYITWTHKLVWEEYFSLEQKYYCIFDKNISKYNVPEL